MQIPQRQGPKFLIFVLAKNFVCADVSSSHRKSNGFAWDLFAVCYCGGLVMAAYIEFYFSLTLLAAVDSVPVVVILNSVAAKNL